MPRSRGRGTRPRLGVWPHCFSAPSPWVDVSSMWLVETACSQRSGRIEPSWIHVVSRHTSYSSSISKTPWLSPPPTPPDVWLAFRAVLQCQFRTELSFVSGEETAGRRRGRGTDLRELTGWAARGSWGWNFDQSCRSRPVNRSWIDRTGCLLFTLFRKFLYIYFSFSRCCHRRRRRL